MPFDTNWDIEQYRNDNEYAVHWELRKSFMETHKDKYPEERLVALSKISANVEFLGCTYNLKLTRLIRYLNREVVAIYRYRKEKNYKILQKSSIYPDKKRRKEEEVVVKTKKEEDVKTETKLSMEKITNIADRELLERVRTQQGIKSKFIIYHMFQKSLKRTKKKELLQVSATISEISWKFTKAKNIERPKMVILQMKLDEEVIAEIETLKKITEEAKESVASKAFEELQKYCFTIVLNKNYEKEYKQVTLKYAEPIIHSADPIAMHQGIGARIMKRMGWKGEGLGKSESGIKAPIGAMRNLLIRDCRFVKNAGLGLNNGLFRLMAQKYLKKYKESGETTPLEFSEKYTEKERKKIHSVARTVGLVSTGDANPMRVERKINYWELIVDLLVNEGSTDSHYLIKPTAFL